MDKWKSTGLYEHPAKHQAGTYGNVVLSTAGVYAFRAGVSTMSCPQDWAAAIHAEETGQSKRSQITINLLPELIAALDAKAQEESRSRSNMAAELIKRQLNK